MYKLFLCLRFLFHRRIAIVPILAVMLCVAMDLIVTSLMGGFLDKVRGSVRGLFGDVIVSNGSLSGFGYYDAYTGLDGKEHPGLLQYVRKLPEVKQATPIIESYAILRLPDNRGFTNPVRVVGIVPAEYSVITDFQEGLYWQKPGRGSPVTLEPDNAEARMTKARAARAAGRDDVADSIERDLNGDRQELADMAKFRQSYDWRGPPDFDKTPNTTQPDGPPVPLASRVAGVADPAGVIVGVRVFWPSPDKEAHYPRQRLAPGSERVQLTFMPMAASGATAEKPEMKEFHLVDTSYSHIPQIDQSIAFVPFATLQSCLRMNTGETPADADDGADKVIGRFIAPARVSRVLIKLADGVDLKTGRDAVQAATDAWVADRLEQFRRQPAALQHQSIYYEPLSGDLRANVDVLIWEEANKDYFSAISNQRFIALVMVGVVSLTVVALIWVIFIMIVVEKTKDIGIIKSVGGSAGGVAWIFLLWSAVIGTIGSGLGGTLGWLFIRYINPIERWLSSTISWMTGHETHLFDPRAYLFDSIPARFVWSEMMWVAVSAVLAAVLGALLPAWRAGRMNPVESLRYE